MSRSRFVAARFWELGFIVSGCWPLVGLHSTRGSLCVWLPSNWKLGGLGGEGPVPIQAGLLISAPSPAHLGSSAGPFMRETHPNVWTVALSMAVDI